MEYVLVWSSENVQNQWAFWPLAHSNIRAGQAVAPWKVGCARLVAAQGRAVVRGRQRGYVGTEHRGDLGCVVRRGKGPPVHPEFHLVSLCVMRASHKMGEDTAEDTDPWCRVRVKDWKRPWSHRAWPLVEGCGASVALCLITNHSQGWTDSQGLFLENDRH